MLFTTTTTTIMFSGLRYWSLKITTKVVKTTKYFWVQGASITLGYNNKNSYKNCLQQILIDKHNNNKANKQTNLHNNKQLKSNCNQRNIVLINQ